MMIGFALLFAGYALVFWGYHHFPGQVRYGLFEVMGFKGIAAGKPVQIS
jgi:hypothetical protein